jgi:S1-C subfamily serine protease
VCLPDNFAAGVLKGKDERGVVIKEVMPGSGAAEAGLR